jgi:Mce-associated membrane protein
MSTITTQAGRAVRATVPGRFRRSGARPQATGPDTTDTRSTGTTSTGTTSADTTSTRAARITPRGLWALAALVLVAALAVGATLGRQAWAAHQDQQARAEAVAAAKQLAVNFVTVDYQHVDDDIARVRGGATGTFLQSYSSSVAELKKVLVQNKTVSRAERTEAALVSGDRDSAVVLVGVVAPTQNTSVPDGEKKTYRMRLELRKASDAWKVENLEFVG